MSAMNRKMFSNRDARTKLAGMGGILASSPELMGATQRFETGGQSVPRPGTGYGREAFGEGNIFSSGAGAASGGDMAIVGNTVFYLAENGTVIDREGTVVRDPSIVRAVIQKVSGEQPSQAQLARQGTQARVDIAQQVMAQPETLPPQTEQGIASVLSARGVPPEATANREAALSRLKEQFSELSLFPERDSGKLETIILNQPDVESGPVIAERSTATDPFGPEALAARTAMKERKNQERLSVDAKLDARDAAAVARDAAAVAQQEAARVAARAFLPSENPVGAAQQEAAAQASADRLVASAGYVGEDEPTSSMLLSTMTDSDLEKLLTLAIENEDDALIDEILISSGPRTESSERLALDSDFGADLSPDMVAQLNRLEKLRTAQGIADRSNPVDQFLSGANLVGGALADTVVAGSQLGLEGLGYLSGGGDVSDFFFDQAQGAKNVRTGFRGGKNPDAGTGFFDLQTKNLAPRLFNPSEGPTVEAADKLKRAEIEQDSIRTYADAVLSGNTDLFAEGSVAGDERSAFSELDRSSPVDIGLSPNELAAEEFSQRPDTQDPLTDERLIDIVMAASADGTPPVDTGLLPNELAAIAANNTELGYTDDQMGLTTGFEQPYLTDDDMGLTTGPDFKYVAPTLDGTSGPQVIPDASTEKPTGPGSGLDLSGTPEVSNAATFASDAVDLYDYITGSIADNLKTSPFDETETETETETDADADADAGTGTGAGTGTVDAKTVDQIVGELGLDAEDPGNVNTTPRGSEFEVVKPTAIIKPGAAVDLAEQVTKDPNNANRIVSGAVLDGAGIDTTGMDIKQRTVAMKKVLSDLMGKTPDDKKEEFWMNMAMMGFAVAAGESPDALKNIADGMLAGSATIQQGKASDKKLDQDITLAAINQVFSEDAAAASQASAERIAGMKSDGSGFRNLRNPEEFRQNRFTDFLQFYNNSLTSLPNFGPPKDALAGETNIQYATRQADAAYNAMITGAVPTVEGKKILTEESGPTEAEIRAAAAAKLNM